MPVKGHNWHWTQPPQWKILIIKSDFKLSSGVMSSALRKTTDTCAVIAQLRLSTFSQYSSRTFTQTRWLDVFLCFLFLFFCLISSDMQTYFQLALEKETAALAEFRASFLCYVSWGTLVIVSRPQKRQLLLQSLVNSESSLPRQLYF